MSTSPQEKDQEEVTAEGQPENTVEVHNHQRGPLLAVAHSAPEIPTPVPAGTVASDVDPCTTFTAELLEPDLGHGHGGPTVSQVQEVSTLPSFPKKLKLLLQGAYRRVTPEPCTPDSVSQSPCSGTSSTLQVPWTVAAETAVYTVEVTNNNAEIENSASGAFQCPTYRTGSIDSYEEVCRICHDSNGVDEAFITPCLCKGTMGLVHQRCLERWLGESGKSTCEICGYEYVTERRPKYQGWTSIWSWIRNPINPHDTKNFFFDIACFFVLTPLACISAWLCVVGSQHYALSAQERYKETLNHGRWSRYRQIQDASNSTWTSVGLLTLTGTLLTAYYIWLFVAFRYHYLVWRDWQGRNFQVTVLPVSPDGAHVNAGTDPLESRNNAGTAHGVTVDESTVVIDVETSDSSSGAEAIGHGRIISQTMTAGVIVDTFRNNNPGGSDSAKEASSSQSI